MRVWHRHRLSVLARASRLRRGSTGQDFLGPYYPHISAGLLQLEDTDTGLRFGIVSGLMTVESGSGAYVAYVPAQSRGRIQANRFYLMAE